MRQSVETKATELVENVRREFESSLKLNDWIDDKTKSKALDKLNKMKIIVGYPSELTDPSHVQQLYKQVSKYDTSTGIIQS